MHDYRIYYDSSNYDKEKSLVYMVIIIITLFESVFEGLLRTIVPKNIVQQSKK